ncbi:ATP-binding cassette domain-containing protein [Paenibacillus sp. 2KB_20]|uniref:ABC transporter ATP-binding protein n=1 Tax=Paenibacillus TaxID=44249 RepID=UPI003D2A132D
MSAILFRNLNKTYNGKRGVIDLNLKVDRGEIFGFIGPNGAGKSTTIRLLMQLIAPTSGEIFVLGHRVNGDDPQLRKKIGYLPGEVRLYPDMTGNQILNFTANVYGINLKKSPIHDYAERLQWNGNQKVKSYSLGNRKKLGILLALIHNPELLVLDEPTSGLDPLVQQQFFQILREWNELKGTTVFFSTHILTEVEKLCNQVAIIRDGRLIQVSTLSEVSAAGEHFIEVSFSEIDELGQLQELYEVDRNTRCENGIYRFRIQDKELRSILAMLSKMPVKDLSVRRTSLEEKFMSEYVSGSDGGLRYEYNDAL